VHQVVSAAPSVPGLIRPTWRSMTQAQKGLMMVTALDRRRNQGNKKKYDRMGHWVYTRFYMLVDGEFHLEKFYGRILCSHM